jgi:hypothetical protein
MRHKLEAPTLKPDWSEASILPKLEMVSIQCSARKTAPFCKKLRVGKIFVPTTRVR